MDCPECGSSDVDIAVSGPKLFECQECGAEFDPDDTDGDF